jgi:hypothetical protein
MGLARGFIVFGQRGPKPAKDGFARDGWAFGLAKDCDNGGEDLEERLGRTFVNPEKRNQS